MTSVWGSGGRDTLWGSWDSDDIHAGGGDDVVYGFPQAWPGANPVQFEVAEGGWDLILLGRGNDYAHGGGGTDYMDGEAGRDTLQGGTGGDHLWGGGGADVFRYNLAQPTPGGFALDTLVGDGRRDVIHDFVHGADKIDLRGWQNAFHPGGIFIGEDDPTFNTTMTVGFRHEEGHTIVEISRPFFEPPPGSSPGYFGPAGEIDLLGNHALTAADFILS